MGNKRFIDTKEDGLSIYLKDVRKSSTVTPEKELELAKKIVDGDKRALNELVTANLRFVETRRLNFGNIPKHQISLEHHLLIHDLALIDYIKQEKIIAVQRSGRDILTTDYNDYTITNIDFETFSTTHHCSWFYPRKTRTVALTSANQLVHVDDVDLQVHHIHGHYTDRLVNESTNTIQLNDSATPLYRELEHFVASVEKQDHNSINGLAHIERVYKNLERVTDV